MDQARWNSAFQAMTADDGNQESQQQEAKDEQNKIKTRGEKARKSKAEIRAEGRKKVMEYKQQQNRSFPADTVSRYKSDMEQAEQMRRTPSKHKQQNHQHQRQTASHAGPISTQDYQMGLQGLDEAETLSKAGDLEGALKLYHLSLELLIMILKKGDTTSAAIMSGVVEARVQVALSDAEKIKAKLKNRQQSSESSSQQAGISFSPLSDSITAAIQRGKSQQNKSFPSTNRLAGNKATTNRNRKTRNNTQRLGMKNNVQQQTDEMTKTVLQELYIPSDQAGSTTWESISGLEPVKQSLQEAAILPLMRPDIFHGLRKPQNILLWGPPGTGKTMLVKAAAAESKSNLFICSASSLTSKWMGEAEKLVKALFKVAKQYAPSIIFIDEIDSLLSTRKSDGEHEASRRLKTEFMVQMDGILKQEDTTQQQQKHVLLLACTNCPWDVDSAILRRFPRRIHVPLPDAKARKGLLLALLKLAGKHDLSTRRINDLVQRLDGFSCSDITAIASEASFGPIRSVGNIEDIANVRSGDVRPVNYRDFENALQVASKSVTNEQIKKYKVWQQQQQASGP